MAISAAKQEAIEVADAQLNNFDLPTYTDLRQFVEELRTKLRHEVQQMAGGGLADPVAISEIFADVVSMSERMREGE